MAGVSVKIEIDDAATIAALKELEDLGDFKQAVFKNVGQYLVRSHKARLAKQVSPDGTPFKPLSPAYKKRKKGKLILVESGQLGSYFDTIENGELFVGTSGPHVRIHQEGGTVSPNRRIGQALVMSDPITIPARPHVGLSADDLVEIDAIVRDHIRMLLPISGSPQG